MKRGRFASHEIGLIERLAGTHTVKQVAEMLGRTHGSVNAAAQRLGIRFRRSGGMSKKAKYGDDVAREALRRFRDGETAREIAESMGIPRGTVLQWTSGWQRGYLYEEVMGG